MDVQDSAVNVFWTQIYCSIKGVFVHTGFCLLVYACVCEDICVYVCIYVYLCVLSVYLSACVCLFAIPSIPSWTIRR